MKKFIILNILILITVSLGCSKDKNIVIEDALEDIENEVNEEGITQEQVVNGIRIKNASLIVNDGITEFRLTLENTLTSVKNISCLNINFKDEEDISILKTSYCDIDKLKKNETQNIIIVISSDLTETKNIEYEFEIN
jgi:hypothetical protein